MRIGDIVENACRLAGRDPTLTGVPESWRAIAGFAINEGMRRIYAEKFPQLRKIEYRRYRPTWNAGCVWEDGQECWWEGDYWRKDGPGAGRPSDEGSGWRRLEMEELAPFIAFDQPWEREEIDPACVDKDAFAYEADPKYNPKAAPMKDLEFFEMGVMLQAPAPKAVFVAFTPKYRKIRMNEWSPETKYAKGAVVYLTAAGSCYRAKGDVEAGGATPNTDEGADDWEEVLVDEAWEEYLTKLVAANVLTADQGKFQAKAEADNEFALLQERFGEGMGERRIRTGRFRR